MHASIEQLLTIADGSTSDARAHVDSCARCQREIQRIEALRVAMRSLPEATPSQAATDAIWDRVKASHIPESSQPHATGLTNRHWWPAALAASIAIAAVVVTMRLWQSPEMPVVASDGDARSFSVPANAGTATDELVRQSQQLEQVLGRLQYEPRVVNARTASTIAQLEDQIAWIDYGLGEGSSGDLSASDANALWQQRVDLMNSLVYVRYAQAQRIDF